MPRSTRSGHKPNRRYKIRHNRTTQLSYIPLNALHIQLRPLVLNHACTASYLTAQLSINISKWPETQWRTPCTAADDTNNVQVSISTGPICSKRILHHQNRCIWLPNGHFGPLEAKHKVRQILLWSKLLTERKWTMTITQQVLFVAVRNILPPHP